MRTCGECTLCCKLLPVRELDKGANTRCRHQRHHKGCAVYKGPGMPIPCKLWNCRWLLEDRTGDLRRPDRSGYVIDVMPDFVVVRNDLSGEETNLPVLQIWVDPKRPDDWRADRDLLAYLERLGREEGMCALIRNGSESGIFLAPPNLNSGGTWFESASGLTEKTHTAEDILAAGLNLNFVLEERP